MKYKAQLSLLLTASMLMSSCGGGGSSSGVSEPTSPASSASSAATPAANSATALSATEKAPFLFDWWFRSPINETGCRENYRYNKAYFYKEGHVILNEATMDIEHTVYTDSNCLLYAGSVTESYDITWSKGSAVQAPFDAPIVHIDSRFTHFSMDTQFGSGVLLLSAPNGTLGTRGTSKLTAQVATHEGTTHQALYLPIDGSPVNSEAYPTHLELGELHRHKLVDGCC